ncbi:MAG: hypothetical protein AAB458_00630 [Patescibacteria group bacterium]|mgnify:CR=1 FL=1
MRNPYVPRNTVRKEVGAYELGIVAEYAGLNDHEKVLPSATGQGVAFAAYLLDQEVLQEVAWGNTEHLGPGADVLHKAKLKHLHFFGVSSKRVVSVTSNNTIQEVTEIHKVRPDVKSILLICDGPHARRYRRLLKYFYPDATIDLLTFRALWNENHPSPWQRSRFKWWTINIVYHTIMLCFAYTGQMCHFVEKFGKKMHVN